MNERDLFMAALEIEDPAARYDYLDRACGADAELRQRVDALLQAFVRAGSFLKHPALRAASTSDEAAGGPSLAGPPAEAPGTVIGPYNLMQPLGEGGMGTVFLAEQTEPVQRQVALKLIKSGMDSRQVVARFEVERQALALMDHPNIARVLDAGTTDAGRPYFVMELVQGVPITRHCDEYHLTPQQRLELFVLVCQAVQHAHQKGIIHRDLKPSNVLVCSYDGRPVPKVIDFGIAKATGPRLTEGSLFTEVGVVVGTLEYMSPEQADFHQLDIDTRSDVYALGVLLYELLTGTTPLERQRFKTAGLLESLRIIREEEPPTPSARLSTTEELPSIAANRGLEPRKLNGLVRGELDWIVMKCLEKDRNRRYETASDLARDIEGFLRDEPVRAGPPSAWYRLRKFSRRHRGPLLAGGLVLLLLVGGIIGTSLGYLQAKASAEAEAAERHKAVESEADTRAFADFLARYILAATRPEGVQDGVGVNVTMAEALEKADPKIAEVFAGRPRAEALARHEIGDTWTNLGRYAEALRNLERALALRREVLGPDDPDTLNTLNSLGFTNKEAGERERAISLFEETVAKRKEKLGPDHRDTLISMAHLGMAYLDAGRQDEALPLLEQALAKTKEKLGPDDPQTLVCMDDLATGYHGTGQVDKVLPLLEQVLAKRQETLGPDHPATLASMNNLAWAYKEDAGRLDKALPLLEQVLAKRQEKLGPDHPATLSTMNNLAVAYKDARLLDKALPLYVQALAKRQEKLGPDHPATLQSMNNLAVAYKQTGQLDKALPLYEETLAKRKVKLPPNHPSTLESMANLAGAYKVTGRLDKALPLLEEVLAKRKAKLPPDHPDTLINMNNLAVTYQDNGQLNKALPLLEEVLAKRKAKLPPDHPRTLVSMHNLAKAYLDNGQPKQALPLYEQALPKMQKVLGPDHPTTLTVMSNLALAYKAHGQLKQALPLYEQALLKMQKTLGSDHPTTLAVMNNLASAYKAHGQLDKALPLLEQVLAKRKVKLPPDHPQTLTSMNDLAVAYLDTGQVDKALPLLEQVLAKRKEKLGPNHPDTLKTMPFLATAYYEVGKFDQAEPAREALVRQRQKGEPGSLDTGTCLVLLGSTLLGQQKYAEAEPLLRDCLAIRTKHAPDAWVTFNTHSLLGAALAGQRKDTEAEPLLVQGYEGMKQRQASIPAAGKVRLTEALERLVRLYEATGEKDKAAAWRKKLEERKPGPTKPQP